MLILTGKWCVPIWTANGNAHTELDVNAHMYN